MMQLKRWIFAGSIVALAFSAGCATRSAGPIQRQARVNPSLVMSSPMMMELARAQIHDGADRWEASRNDPALSPVQGLPDESGFYQIHRDLSEYLRISNGIPQENSRYSTRIHQHRSRR